VFITSYNPKLAGWPTPFINY